MFPGGALTKFTVVIISPAVTHPFPPFSYFLSVNFKVPVGGGSIPELADSAVVPTSHLLTSNNSTASLTTVPETQALTKSRRKRASPKPPCPYAWVLYVPEEPIPSSRPNEGSVQGTNRKMRIKLHKSFILVEMKKRVAQMQVARRRKRMDRIEHKMAAVGRERAWAGRLAEIKRIENEKNTTV